MVKSKLITWGDFQKEAKKAGIKDDTEILYIDFTGSYMPEFCLIENQVQIYYV